MDDFKVGDKIEFDRKGETICGSIISVDKANNFIQIKSPSKGKIYSLPLNNLHYTEKTVKNQSVKVIDMLGFNALKK